MRRSPLTTINVVEVLKVACEYALFDFKRRYDIADATMSFEIAKDVTAFANHSLGGTIAVEGAEEPPGLGTRWVRQDLRDAHP